MGVSDGILYGDFNFTLPAHMNYGKVFLDKILQYGDKLAVVDADTGMQITFSEMGQNIVNIAYSLVQLGVKKGDVIAICSENNVEFLPTAIAVLYCGAVLTFVNHSYKKDEIIYICNISKPKYIFMSTKAYDAHYEIMKGLNTIKQFFIFAGKDKGYRDVIRYEDLVANNVNSKNYGGASFYGRAHTALILYSSGTTGLPKGVRMSHLNYLTTTHHPPPTHRRLTMLTVSPLANTMGLVGCTEALFVGKTVIYLSKFDEELYLKCIEKFKVGMLLAAPPSLTTLCKSMYITKYDVSSLELIHCGGAVLEVSTVKDLKSRFRNLHYVLQGYGMTETCGVITRETEDAYKLGSVGRTVAGCIIKIVDIETRHTLGPGRIGELCVKGSVLLEEYIGKDMKEFIEDGYYKSGDVAYYDEDGYIYIVDRMKEIIKYKAWQVSPSELEAIMLKHPSVKEVAVVGAPDKDAGELPTAFVVKSSAGNATEKELMEFVASKVSPWKKLRGGVRFVEDIPKNTSGKILRRILRERLIKPTSKL